MGRQPLRGKKEEAEGMKKRGAWTAEEDSILSLYIHSHGEGKWNSLPRRAGLKRCGKSCRLRWLNYLRPDIKRGNISPDEEDLIIRLHKLLGNRWSLIAGRLPGRTDNEIKNYWNTTLNKKLMEAEAASSNQHTKPDLVSQNPAPMKTNTLSFNSIHQVDHRHLLSLPPQDELQFMDETSPHVHFNDDALGMNLKSFHELCLPGVGGGHVGTEQYLFANPKQVVQEEAAARDGGYDVIQQQQHQQMMIGNEVADDFNFIAELLDYEGGWLGNF